MTLNRRALLAAGLAMPALHLPHRALGQAVGYPNRVVRLVVPFPPGGGTDIIGRILAERLTQKFGQSFIIDNKGGAGGNIGTDFVSKAEPDGYTLLLGTVSASAINYALYGAALPYKPADLASVALVLTSTNVIFVHPSVPVKTLKELIAYVKERPGKMTIGSSGNGTTVHLTGEMFKKAAGLDLNTIPYRGVGPMLQDMIAGRLDVGADNLMSCIGHVKAGRLRALAVTQEKRAPVLPDVPTVVEQGVPDVLVSAWYGVQAPARTPREIVERLGTEIDAIMREPEIANRFAEQGADPLAPLPAGVSAAAHCDAYIKADIKKWADVIQRTGVKPE